MIGGRGRERPFPRGVAIKRGREGGLRCVNRISSSSSCLGAGGGLGQGRDVELGIHPWTGGSRPAGEQLCRRGLKVSFCLHFFHPKSKVRKKRKAGR